MIEVSKKEEAGKPKKANSKYLSDTFRETSTSTNLPNTYGIRHKLTLQLIYRCMTPYLPEKNLKKMENRLKIPLKLSFLNHKQIKKS